MNNNDLEQRGGCEGAGLQSCSTRNVGCISVPRKGTSYIHQHGTIDKMRDLMPSRLR